MPIGVTVPVVVADVPDIRIDIHVPDHLFSLDGFETALERSMKSIADETRDFWVTQAGQRLTTTRESYVNSIVVESTSGSSLSVTLDGGVVPYLLEVGSPPYNMNIKKGQIVPLNVNRQFPFTNPTVFRTGTGSPWKHPGFPGLNIVHDVLEELTSNILPKYVQQIVEEL